MRAFALVSSDDDEAVEVFVREADAVAAMHSAVFDVPEWDEILRVEPIELDDPHPSLN